jgi:hypothetical protein
MKVGGKVRERVLSRPKLVAPRGDDGVILVFWALALTTIVGLLAFTIDWGFRVQSDTNAQNAADTAAVAALYTYYASPPSDATLAATSEVLSVASPYGYGGNLDWNNCNPPATTTDFSSFVDKCVAFGHDPSGNLVAQVEMPVETAYFLGLSSVQSGNQVAYAVLKTSAGNGTPEGQLCYITPTSENC